MIGSRIMKTIAAAFAPRLADNVSVLSSRPNDSF